MLRHFHFFADADGEGDTIIFSNYNTFKWIWKQAKSGSKLYS